MFACIVGKIIDPKIVLLALVVIQFVVLADGNCPLESLLAILLLEILTVVIAEEGRFADIVGRERVIAGSDCGFSTFAGYGTVDADITYAKLNSLVKGAVIASEKLW